MRALVTGATGCVGSALAAHLIESGDAVRALVRVGADRGALPGGVEVVPGSLDDGEALRAAVRGGVDVIYHAAAKVHDASGDRAEFERVNVGGTRRLLDACDREGVAPRIVFFSTVAVYGEATPPEGVPEDAPPAPATPYAETKLRGEALVARWAEGAGTKAVVLRVATVYGPRDRGNMARMLAAIGEGRFLLPGGGYNRKTCVAVETVARAARAAAAAASPPAMLVVADPGGAYRLRDLAAEMARALGASSPGKEVPVPVLRAAACGCEVLSRMLRRRPPLTRAQVKRLAADNVYQSRRMREIIEDSRCISLSDGMARAVSSENAVPVRQRRR